MLQQEALGFGQTVVVIQSLKRSFPAPLMRRQVAAGDLFLDTTPGLIGQSKTDRVWVIGKTLSPVTVPNGSLIRAYNANAMFALQTVNRDLQHPRK